MTEELPPLVFLDMAAKQAGRSNWAECACQALGNEGRSIIAHARTLERLAKHEPDIVPVDEDVDRLIAIIKLWDGSFSDWSRDQFTDDHEFHAALAQFKAELAGRK